MARTRTAAENRQTWNSMADRYDRYAEQQTKEADKKHWQARAVAARAHAFTYKE